MRIIGITGGVGAGKTQILTYLKEEYKAVLLIADRIAEELMKSGTSCYEQIWKTFPKSVFDGEGAINRSKMADLIFREPDYRLRLNGIVHPAVKQYVQEQINREREKHTELVVIEAALLIEEHYDAFCDELWYIDTDETIRRARLSESRGYSEQKISEIMKTQLTEEKFRRHADVVIFNNGTIEETNRQIKNILESKGEDLNGQDKRQ